MSDTVPEIRYWDDYEVGEETVHGTHRVTEQEIIEFAQRYDPQPFHVDPVKAVDGPYGGLIASGWHTIALYMGLLVRNETVKSAGQGSPGVDEVRWLVPVRPGDELTARGRIVDKWPSETKPGRGTVVHEHEMVNQRGEVVMRFRGRGYWGRRPEADEATG